MVIDKSQRTGGTGHHAGFYRLDRASVRLKPRRFRGGIVRDHCRNFRLPSLDSEKKIFSPEFVGSHVHELLDVDGGKDGLFGAILASIHTFNAGALSVFYDQAGHTFVHKNHAAVSPNVTRQRLRKDARTAFWNAARRCPDGSVGEATGHGILRRLVSEWAGQQKRAAVVVLEIVANDFPLRHGRAALPEVAVGNFRQPVVQWLAEADRCEGDGFKDGAYFLELGQHPPVSGCVFLREFCELSAGAVEIAPLREPCSIRKWHVDDGIGFNVFQSVLFEIDLIVLEHGIHQDGAVRGGADIVIESAQSQLLSLDRAADYRPALEYQATIAGFGEVGRGDQAVMTCTGYHHIEFVRFRGGSFCAC